MADRAERVEFVPLSLDPGQLGRGASARPVAAFRADRSIPLQTGSLLGALPIALPDSPAMVCERGIVVQANLAAVRLAGRWLPDSLTGLALHHLLTRPGTDAELIGPDGRAVPVRVTRWTVPGTDLLMVFLVDISDLCSAGHTSGNGELVQERDRLLESQRIARIGSFTWDWPTSKLDYSPALAELFAGRCVDAADPLRHIHPEDLPNLLRRVHEMVSDPDADTLEMEFRGLPEHGETYYLCRLRAERSATGSVARLLGTVQDVTQGRAVERALRAEQHRLTQAQRVARIGTWEWDPGSDQLVWSDVMQDLYGVSTRQTSYQTFLSLVHHDDREWVDDLWRQLVVDQVPVECEHRVMRPDGAVRTFRCHGAAITDPFGSRRFIGTVQDVTEQRATEARMMRSSQRFADLVAITPVGIGIFDDRERLVDANEALCKLLGYDLETLRGMSSEALTHPDERTDRLRTLRIHQVVGSESYTVPQRMLLRADGDPVYCELHVSASVQDDGQRFLLVIFTDITERRRVAADLTYRATHDELTGLPNRAAIKDTLTELLASGARDIAVLFCNIDNFKRVNDALGHDAGDELLVALARWLQDGLPEGCTAGRLSGDVFVVICSDVAAQGGVSSLVARVSGLLRTAIPLRGQLIRVSAAIGVAVPDASTSGAQDLLRFADAAMFEAKRTGAGHFAMANAALIASADRQVELECQLREALARDELQLHYQPVVNPDGVILSAEALIRWPHPEHGMLSPDVFLPVAEQGDLMRELNRWVLRTATHEARDWVTRDGRPVAVAVNLADPGESDFVATVASAVIESALPWDRLVVELVETTLIGLPSATRQAMAELVERGVRFAVDDFGTGYSSLARLKELPAHILKLDRRFVSGVDVDPSDFAVVRAVVDMSRAMNRVCVAEGVETATQFEVLRELGVDAYQGWLFSRALPGPDFRALLNRGPLLR
ncbi:MAG: EAL domain-containing protein [Actinomycetota bacterium]|nr:EAL domain-containing protein [Actinomycetota bacterium]